MNRSARGQTLVLFSLTMLLLVVMVTMTLAIGMKAREKVELQTLADATAYSNAVATARVYNTISVWSRAQVSTMVVLAGAQSHISFAGWYMGALRATAIAAAAAATACGIACANPWGACMCPSCVNVGRIAWAFNNEYNNKINTFKSLDRIAGLEARALQGKAAMYGVIQKALYAEHGLTFVRKNGFAEDFLKLAVPDASRRGEYKVAGMTDGAVIVSARELASALANDSNPYPALPATHGTRESAFIRTRGGIIPPARPITLYAQNQGIGGYFNAAGAGYFGRGRHNTNERDAKEAWADDDGWQTGGLVFGGCVPWFVPPSPTSAHVRSTHDADSSDQHRWLTGAPHNGSVDSVHTMGSCGSQCPSVWILRAQYDLDPDNANRGYNSGQSGGLNDQWRQPKTYVSFERDYTSRTIQDPWNLMFRFRLQADDDKANVDIGKQQNMESKFENQLALATGITYYHRHMQDTSLAWQEPPNFFNPFWRATLVPADIDSQGATDIPLTLTRSNTSFGVTYGALKGAGFRGFQ